MASTDTPTGTTFGQWLADRRHAAGLEQEEAARRLYAAYGSKITGAQISDYEHNRNTPSGQRLWEMLAVYGVAYDQQPPPSGDEELVELRAEVRRLRAVAEVTAATVATLTDRVGLLIASMPGPVDERQRADGRRKRPVLQDRTDVPQ